MKGNKKFVRTTATPPLSVELLQSDVTPSMTMRKANEENELSNMQNTQNTEKEQQPQESSIGRRGLEKKAPSTLNIQSAASNAEKARQRLLFDLLNPTRSRAECNSTSITANTSITNNNSKNNNNNSSKNKKLTSSDSNTTATGTCGANHKVSNNINNNSPLTVEEVGLLKPTVKRHKALPSGSHIKRRPRSVAARANGKQPIQQKQQQQQQQSCVVSPYTNNNLANSGSIDNIISISTSTANYSVNKRNSNTVESVCGNTNNEANNENKGNSASNKFELSVSATESLTSNKVNTNTKILHDAKENNSSYANNKNFITTTTTTITTTTTNNNSSNKDKPNDESDQYERDYRNCPRKHDQRLTLSPAPFRLRSSAALRTQNTPTIAPSSMIMYNSVDETLYKNSVSNYNSTSHKQIIDKELTLIAPMASDAVPHSSSAKDIDRIIYSRCTSSLSEAKEIYSNNANETNRDRKSRKRRNCNSVLDQGSGDGGISSTDNNININNNNNNSGCSSINKVNPSRASSSMAPNNTFTPIIRYNSAYIEKLTAGMITPFASINLTSSSQRLLPISSKMRNSASISNSSNNSYACGITNSGISSSSSSNNNNNNSNNNNELVNNNINNINSINNNYGSNVNTTSSHIITASSPHSLEMCREAVLKRYGELCAVLSEVPCEEWMNVLCKKAGTHFTQQGSYNAQRINSGREADKRGVFNKANNNNNSNCSSGRLSGRNRNKARNRRRNASTEKNVKNRESRTEEKDINRIRSSRSGNNNNNNNNNNSASITSFTNIVLEENMANNDSARERSMSNSNNHINSPTVKHRRELSWSKHSNMSAEILYKDGVHSFLSRNAAKLSFHDTLKYVSQYCEQYLQPYVNKMNIMLTQRNAVRDAVEHFVRVHSEFRLFCTELYEPLSTESSSTSNVACNMQESERRYTNRHVKLQQYADMLTTCLQQVQHRVVELLLHMAHVAKEIRKPLGTVEVALTEREVELSSRQLGNPLTDLRDSSKLQQQQQQQQRCLEQQGHELQKEEEEEKEHHLEQEKEQHQTLEQESKHATNSMYNNNYNINTTIPVSGNINSKEEGIAVTKGHPYQLPQYELNDVCNLNSAMSSMMSMLAAPAGYTKFVTAQEKEVAHELLSIRDGIRALLAQSHKLIMASTPEITHTTTAKRATENNFSESSQTPVNLREREYNLIEIEDANMLETPLFTCMFTAACPHNNTNVITTPTLTTMPPHITPPQLLPSRSKEHTRKTKDARKRTTSASTPVRMTANSYYTNSSSSNNNNNSNLSHKQQQQQQHSLNSGKSNTSADDKKHAAKTPRMRAPSTLNRSLLNGRNTMSNINNSSRMNNTTSVNVNNNNNNAVNSSTMTAPVTTIAMLSNETSFQSMHNANAIPRPPLCPGMFSQTGNINSNINNSNNNNNDTKSAVHFATPVFVVNSTLLWGQSNMLEHTTSVDTDDKISVSERTRDDVPLLKLIRKAIVFVPVDDNTKNLAYTELNAASHNSSGMITSLAHRNTSQSNSSINTNRLRSRSVSVSAGRQARQRSLSVATRYSFTRSDSSMSHYSKSNNTSNAGINCSNSSSSSSYSGALPNVVEEKERFCAKLTHAQMQEALSVWDAISSVMTLSSPANKSETMEKNTLPMVESEKTIIPTSKTTEEVNPEPLQANEDGNVNETDELKHHVNVEEVEKEFVVTRIDDAVSETILRSNKVETNENISTKGESMYNKQAKELEDDREIENSMHLSKEAITCKITQESSTQIQQENRECELYQSLRMSIHTPEIAETKRAEQSLLESLRKATTEDVTTSNSIHEEKQSLWYNNDNNDNNDNNNVFLEHERHEEQSESVIQEEKECGVHKTGAKILHAVQIIAQAWRTFRARIEYNKKRELYVLQLEEHAHQAKEAMRWACVKRCLIAAILKRRYRQLLARQHGTRLLQKNRNHSEERKSSEKSESSVSVEESKQYVTLSTRERFLQAKEQRAQLASVLLSQHNECNCQEDKNIIDNNDNNNSNDMSNIENINIATENKSIHLLSSPQQHETSSSSSSETLQKMLLHEVRKHPLPLSEKGISTCNISHYNTDADSFEVTALHRLLHAPQPLVYLLCVLTDRYPTRPPMGYAPLKENQTTSISPSLARKSLEVVEVEDNIGKQEEEKEEEEEEEEEKEVDSRENKNDDNNDDNHNDKEDNTSEDAKEAHANIRTLSKEDESEEHYKVYDTNDIRDSKLSQLTSQLDVLRLQYFAFVKLQLLSSPPQHKANEHKTVRTKLAKNHTNHNTAKKSSEREIEMISEEKAVLRNLTSSSHTTTNITTRITRSMSMHLTDGKDQKIKQAPLRLLYIPPACSSVCYKSLIIRKELCMEKPVIKPFPRPFERWNNAHRLLRRIFCAGAIYAWKLIFSHTPHDDYKQRILQSNEERVARLQRVQQRNQMILACYNVHSERAWMREASSDLSFVAQLVSPKRAFNSNDPHFAKHCRESFEFVEDFIYQCFPTVSSLDDVPSFLIGAGVYFVLQETLHCEYNALHVNSVLNYLPSHVIQDDNVFMSNANVNHTCTEGNNRGDDYRCNDEFKRYTIERYEMIRLMQMLCECCHRQSSINKKSHNEMHGNNDNDEKEEEQESEQEEEEEEEEEEQEREEEQEVKQSIENNKEEPLNEMRCKRNSELQSSTSETESNEHDNSQGLSNSKQENAASAFTDHTTHDNHLVKNDSNNDNHNRNSSSTYAIREVSINVKNSTEEVKSEQVNSIVDDKSNEYDNKRGKSVSTSEIRETGIESNNEETKRAVWNLEHALLVCVHTNLQSVQNTYGSHKMTSLTSYERSLMRALIKEARKAATATTTTTITAASSNYHKGECASSSPSDDGRLSCHHRREVNDNTEACIVFPKHFIELLAQKLTLELFALNVELDVCVDAECVNEVRHEHQEKTRHNETPV